MAKRVKRMNPPWCDWVSPWEKRPNTMPVFLTETILKKCGTTSVSVPNGSFVRTRYLVAWSKAKSPAPTIP